MYSADTIKQMMELFTDPLFKKGFFDFFGKTQTEGIEAARKFWGMHQEKDVFAGAPEMFEKMVDFYITLGFVPHHKYEDAVKENEKLKKEVEFLRATLTQLQAGLFTEGAQKAQEHWKSIVEKQFDTNKEMAKNFFEIFKNVK